MRSKILVVAIAVVVLSISGCSRKGVGGARTAPGSGDILVGEYDPLTGARATFGTSTHNGIMMAIDEVNGAGGVGGRKIKVVTEDDESQTDEAANAVTKLISENQVIALLGEVSSSASIAAAPIAQANRVPMISPSSTNPAVTKKGDYIFRVCFTDDDQGTALADLVAKQLGVKRVALLTDVKSDDSRGLAKAFAQEFAANGGQIVARASYASGDGDFHSQLASIKRSSPGALFVPGDSSDIDQIAQQARELGVRVPLVGGDGWESPKLIEIGGAALNGCYYSSHYFAGDPAPLVRDFVTKYQQRFSTKPDSMAALGYDAARVLADAMKRAKRLDGPSLRNAIAATKNFPGVTGTITLGPERNPVGKKLVIVEIRDGQPTLKATIDPMHGGVQPTAARPRTP